jgi:hypothetical protein
MASVRESMLAAHENFRVFPPICKHINERTIFKSPEKLAKRGERELIG